jgi:hypothetical protein
LSKILKDPSKYSSKETLSFHAKPVLVGHKKYMIFVLKPFNKFKNGLPLQFLDELEN